MTPLIFGNSEYAIFQGQSFTQTEDNYLSRTIFCAYTSCISFLIGGESSTSGARKTFDEEPFPIELSDQPTENDQSAVAESQPTVALQEVDEEPSSLEPNQPTEKDQTVIADPQSPGVLQECQTMNHLNIQIMINP